MRSFNENAPALLPGFTSQFRPTFPIGHSNSTAVYGYLQLSFMRNFFVPMMAFVDGGVIRAQYTGKDPFFGPGEGANIRAQLDSMLKVGAGSKKVGAPKKKA
ncbi:MAG: hypothetical protein ACRD44_13345 [Bryobacteraceae bacterium]